MKRVLLFLFAVVATSCGRDAEQIHCDDLLPEDETSFGALALVITDRDDPRNCSQCHNGSSPLFGLNLETPQAAYFTMRDRIDRVYASVASGSMPEDGLEWGETELRLLRSWYCRGALYD